MSSAVATNERQKSSHNIIKSHFFSRFAFVNGVICGLLLIVFPQQTWLWNWGVFFSWLLSSVTFLLSKEDEHTYLAAKEAAEKAEMLKTIQKVSDAFIQQEEDFEQEKSLLLAEIEKWKQEAKLRRIEKQSDEKSIIEGLYNQLRSQFEEKKAMLDQTRKELYVTQTVLGALQRDFDEKNLLFDWDDIEILKAETTEESDQEIAQLEEIISHLGKKSL